MKILDLIREENKSYWAIFEEKQKKLVLKEIPTFILLSLSIYLSLNIYTYTHTLMDFAIFKNKKCSI